MVSSSSTGHDAAVGMQVACRETIPFEDDRCVLRRNFMRRARRGATASGQVIESESPSCLYRESIVADGLKQLDLP